MGELQCLEPKSCDGEVSRHNTKGSRKPPCNEVQPPVVRDFIRLDPVHISSLDEFEIDVCQERDDDEGWYMMRRKNRGEV